MSLEKVNNYWNNRPIQMSKKLDEQIHDDIYLKDSQEKMTFPITEQSYKKYQPFYNKDNDKKYKDVYSEIPISELEIKNPKWEEILKNLEKSVLEHFNFKTAHYGSPYACTQ